MPTAAKASLQSQLDAAKSAVAARLSRARPDPVRFAGLASRLPDAVRRMAASVEPGLAGVWPIGVDIGDSGVRMLQLAPTGDGGASVVAAAKIDLPPAQETDHATPRRELGSAVIEAIGAMLASGQFYGRRATVTLPRAIAQVKTVRSQPGESDDSGANAMPAATVAREVQSALGIDLRAGKHVCHFLPAEPLRRGEGREGLAAVANAAEVDRYVAGLHASGLEVGAVDFEPLALLRCVNRFGRRDRDAREALAVVDLGDRATRVAVGRGGVLSFYKSLSFGGRTIHAAVAAALGLSEAEARLLCLRSDASGGAPGDRVDRAIAAAQRLVVEQLGRELAMCLRYYAVTFQGRPPTRVVVTGGAATDGLRRLLAETLEASLPLTVVPRRAYDDVAPAADTPAAAAFVPEDDRLWFAALGLALRDAPDRLRCGGGQSRRQQIEADAAADRLVLETQRPPSRVDALPEAA